MGRRRHFGSIRRLPSGRWQARYQGPDGRRRSAPRTFTSHRDAARWLSVTEHRILTGEWGDPAAGNVKVSEWAVRWLDGRIDLKPTTYRTYQMILRSRIVPTFGEMPLRSLTPMGVQEWAASMQERGLSASSIRQSVHLLGAIMKGAVREGMIRSNPCEVVRLPPLPRTEIEVLDAGEVEALANAIQKPFDLLVHIGAYGGLRFGELGALRRRSCDLERRRLHVTEAVVEVDGRLIVGTPKTHQWRSVVLPTFVVSRLASHFESMAPDDGEFLFGEAMDRPLRYSAFRRHVWKPALVAAGLHSTLGVHVLRHTCASLLIANGASIKLVQRQLGHASAELTLDRYGHLYPSELDELVEAFDRIHTRSRRDE